jgi:hypothetical protein
MGNMTVLQARTELRYRCGNPTTNDVPDSQLNNLLTWSLQTISQPTVHRHMELWLATPTSGPGSIPLVAGQQDYALPAICTAIYDIWNFTVGYKLLPRAIWWLDERPNNPPAQGQPRTYARFGNNFRVLNVPTLAYQGNVLVVRYWAEPTFPADGVPFPLRNLWDEVIILGSVMRYYQMRGDVMKAEAHREAFTSAVQSVTDQLSAEVMFDPDWELQVDPVGQQWVMPWR